MCDRVITVDEKFDVLARSLLLPRR